ncbi:MAG: putative lipoprotein YmbA [Candidatus Azotimanducaceae bacterium]|jgi:uncharacterized lipoprotein YmbA
MNNLLTSILIVMTLTGCSSVIEQPIRYYVINPVEQQAVELNNPASSFNIRVLDLSIPQYLEHFQIAKRSGEQELTFSDDHQWGENLRKNLIRTLARNLSRQLGSPNVFTPLVRSSSKPDYAITISIDQFEQVSDGEVKLSVRYQIFDPSEKDILITKVFERGIVNTRNKSFPAMVSTMQTLYNGLCLDISKTLISIEGTKR